MKRRHFIASAGAVGTLGSIQGCGLGGKKQELIADMTYNDLLETYRGYLFDGFLPFMDRYVIDHEYGGFMCTVDSQGNRINDAKRAWYEGRGTWTYAFLYNQLEKNPRHLETAANSVAFAMKHQPQPGTFWPANYTRQGEAVGGGGGVYGNLFIAEGLSEYAIASGKEEYRDLAKKIVLDCLRIYDDPSYTYRVTYLSPDAPVITGTRVLGHWMVFLRAATQFLEHGPDPEMEILAERCVEAIMRHHMNPDYQLIMEAVEHDFSIPNNEFSQFCYTGHAIETLWMVLFEAARLKDRVLFKDTYDSFRRHAEVAKDRVYGGFFRSLDHVDNNVWKTDKVLWLQEEVLIGSLFVYEHTGDRWSREVFGETFDYVRETFIRDDSPLWKTGGNRKVDNVGAGSRAEHYHHPRHLMLNILALERIVKKNGPDSGYYTV